MNQTNQAPRHLCRQFLGVMVDMKRKLVRWPGAQSNHRALRHLFCWSFLWLLVGLSGHSVAHASSFRVKPASSAGPGPQFAIADFDGDLRPDLARITTTSNVSGATDYWIQLRLTASGRQSIQLIAPEGGLQIEARDVNGDHAVDLVVSTAWHRQPVAVFLNDGHGSFVRVAPSLFPGAFTESATTSTSATDQATDAVAVPSQSSVGIVSEAQNLPHARSQTSSIPPSNAVSLLKPFLISHAGRAPPSQVPHL